MEITASITTQKQNKYRCMVDRSNQSYKFKIRPRLTQLVHYYIHYNPSGRQINGKY